jgi:outer membrane lipase/esterase
MNHPLRRWLGALALVTAAVCAAPALAAPYTSLVVFGDSLSDTGNLYLATGGAQPTPGTGPYAGGRFSDGPLWVETLAAGLGLAGDADPYLIGGNNYAFAGARTGTDASPPGILAQVAGLWGATHGVADPNALYVVVAGGNDMRDARSAVGGTDATRQAAAAAAAANIGGALGLLASKGAKNVLLANLPDLGYTPEAALLGLTAESADASARFNAMVAQLEGYAESVLGLNVGFLDLAGIGSAIRNDALFNGGAVYGITNALFPCAGFLGSNGASCEVSAFSDGLHPSAKVHAIIGNAALDLLKVPEPATPLLAMLGLVALMAARRRA